MIIQKKPPLVYWNYFLALESDLERLSRYIEFSKGNYKTYSVELAHLLLAASSEVDVIAKGICKLLDPHSQAQNIVHYRSILTKRLPSFQKEYIYISRYNLKFRPWSNFDKGVSPKWWKSYTNVKHHRDQFFADANLKNTLNAIGGLLICIYYFYKLKLGTRYSHSVTDLLVPPSQFVRLQETYYAQVLTTE